MVIPIAFLTLSFIAAPDAPPTTQPEASDFLRRVEDRNLREDYQNRFHVVVRDEDFQKPLAAQPPQSQPASAPNPANSQSNASSPPTGSSKPDSLSLPIIVGIALPLFVVLLAVARRKSAGKKT